MAQINAYNLKWLQLIGCQVEYNFEHNAYSFINSNGTIYKLGAEHIAEMSSTTMDHFTRNPFDYLKLHAYHIENHEHEIPLSKKSSKSKIRKVML